MASTTSAHGKAGAPSQVAHTFPIQWQNPNDSQLMWILNTHVEGPILPLTDGIATRFTKGGNQAYIQFGMPFIMRTARINSYCYLGVVLTDAPPEIVMKLIGAANRVAPGFVQKMLTKLMADTVRQQMNAITPHINQLQSYWEAELLPEIRQHIAYFETSNLAGFSMAQMCAHWSETLDRIERMGTLHMQAVLCANVAISQFEELFCELFPNATALDAYRLLQGFDNQTLDGNRVLWQLSRVARNNPVIAAILASQPPADVIPALKANKVGHEFLGKLQAYLDQYGRRLNTIYDLHEPDWIENPAIPLHYLKMYSTQRDSQYEDQQGLLITERDQAINNARTALRNYPQAVVEQFEVLLRSAQVATVIHEDHNYWIDQRLFYHIRKSIQAFAVRLAETGVIQQASDIFLLESEDVLNDARYHTFQTAIGERHAEIKRCRNMIPPATLGTPPPFEIADGGPLLRAFLKNVGTPTTTAKSDTVQGYAGSKGVAFGRARILHSLAEADKFQPGEVLVAAVTLPTWTPLFAIAAAVVTDSGGVLSHSAIVAREYHIPAVVGTGTATTCFHDGQLLEVDGTAGIVRVVTNSL